MKLTNIKYHSLSYLNDWIQFDEEYISSIRSSEFSQRVESLNRIAIAYRVARTLPKKHEQNERLFEATKYLDSIDNIINECPIETVEEYTRRLKNKYKVNAQSAASKFLWMKFKSPIIIYDSQAVNWLRKRGFKNNSSYKDFYTNWTTAFEEYQIEIENVCCNLQSVLDYCIDPKINTDKINSATKSKWFQERIFDKILWSQGRV